MKIRINDEKILVVIIALLWTASLATLGFIVFA